MEIEKENTKRTQIDRGMYFPTGIQLWPIKMCLLKYCSIGGQNHSKKQPSYVIKMKEMRG